MIQISNTGEVLGATLLNAHENIKVFAQDITEAHDLVVEEIYRLEDDDDRGHFAYALDLKKNGMERRLRIGMPGLPLEEVRYLGLPGQRADDFRRLDLDRSSWLWKFAVDLSQIERLEGQWSFMTRCAEEAQVNNRHFRCERDHNHKGLCQAKAVLAGYSEKELGPNIWTFFKWQAARNILT